MRLSTKILGVGIVVVAICAAVVWYVAWREDRRGVLTVSFLDIGQGDAIFIEAPSGRKVLIDGGPFKGNVLQQLGKVMPWYDRSIDVVIPTHPDADHIAGIVDVLPRFAVSYIIQSSVRGSTPTWSTLEQEIAEKQKEGTKVLIAKRGQIIDLGDGAYLEVLSPDRSLPTVDTNTACVVTRLVYGSTAFMLGCDAPQAIENYLVALDGTTLKSDVLKAGHHGSKTSSSPLFVGYVNPSYAVLSRGCDNTYGFPHAQTVATFKKFGIPTEDTCKQGTITFVSDGEKVTLR